MDLKDLKGLFVGYNEDDDVRILIAATCLSDAINLAYDYKCIEKLAGEFVVKPYFGESLNFTCEYVIV